MKKRWVKVDDGADGLPDLFSAVASMQTAAEARALLLDLCTPAELEALADRWHVVPYLLQGMPYREIHDQTAVSVTTIGRVARCLTMGKGGYPLAAQRLGLPGIAVNVSPTARAPEVTTRANATGRKFGKGKQK